MVGITATDDPARGMYTPTKSFLVPTTLRTSLLLSTTKIVTRFDGPGFVCCLANTCVMAAW
jgi:hypothetical protein